MCLFVHIQLPGAGVSEKHHDADRQFLPARADAERHDARDRAAVGHRGNSMPTRRSHPLEV